MTKSRWTILAGLAVLGVGTILTAILGLFVYMSATATPLHPNAQDIPTVKGTAPGQQWANAVEQARQIARAGLLDQNLPGLSVAVGAGGELVWAEGFGWADLENRVPVAPETRFKIGTASTVLTSAAVGLLLERGTLNLDEVIQTHVPAYPQKQWPVTLRQVMGHTAGIVPDEGDEEPLSVESGCATTTDGLQRFARTRLLFEPGTQFRYSSYGWILVSAAIEAAAAEPFFTYMRKQVLEPLGMDDTRADSATEPIPGRAIFYFPRFAADPRYGPQEPSEVDYSCFAGASRFLSTPSDLVRFGLAINGGKLLQPATVQLLQTSQRLPSGQETQYGLGWDIETVTLTGQQTRDVGHDGELMGGNAASLLTFPERGIVVAVISNTAFTDTFALGTKIAQAFAEQGKSPAPKK